MWAMGNFGDLNPITMIWWKLAINALLASKLSKFHKLAKMVVVQNMGPFEDEIVVSTLSITKMKLRNKLTNHLDLKVRMSCQKHWRLDIFHLTMPMLHANK
jgi:predicted transcriptional regulator